MNRPLSVSILGLFAAFASAEETSSQAQPAKHRIVGLFEPSRETDLREALAKVPGVTLTSLDLEHGEGVFSYDPAFAFKGTQPEKVVEKFGELLRNVSHQTLSIQPLVTTPRDKFAAVEILVVPLDCKACALALHEILVKTDGVAQAIVSRKDGHITALIDPEKTSRGALEDLLKKREVRLATP